MLPAIIAPLLSGLFSIIDKTVENKDEAQKIKSRLQEMTLQGRFREIEAAADIIRAEAQGDSWLQRNWRPMLMVLFGVIIANNYLVVPLFGTPAAEIPPDLWALLKLGVGGYVLGRSAEKSVRALKEK
ncbi:3TM-type holin [Varunaivibrio sulfuroxidans]|uniref:Holin (3TMs family) n=1 Tax=Varunaivibrio sulfuroxidans TaxID=1773489 RepID=A0A4V2UND4_9PROT|nr:3TM-type holin [Varunaivibrio sulfuroxidans]TCS61681.1 holin (3TMs family) [Varunaivibrio sulfuroxidans]WES32136.1 3TM-type holin [Varunaivibrio sulfuroxidans]